MLIFKGSGVIAIFTLSFLLGGNNVFAQKKEAGTQKITKQFKKITKTLYGQASFYAAKFEGRKTANGQIFSHKKFTAACNSLPLGTFIKVTNLSNGKILVVQTNDRLNKKTKRLIDLTMAGAKRLDFVNAGLARVKVEVLGSHKE